ncbi:MAG: serine hydrolase [Nannocystaceae bacterium]
MRGLLIGALLTLVAGLGGCTDASVRDADPGALTPAMGEQLRWTLDVINHRRPLPDDAELDDHFSTYLLERSPHGATQRLLRGYAKRLAPLTIDRVLGSDGAKTSFVADSRQGRVRVLLDLDGESGRLRGIFIDPYLDRSIEGLVELVPTLAPRAQLLLAEVVDGRCQPLAGVGGDEPLAIAEASRLYVLHAVADAIVDGDLRWDTPLTIRDAWKDAASSTMADATDGEALSIRAFAEAMMWRGDTTAADHLIRALGRERVEAAVRAAGTREPERDVPYLTSREAHHLQALDRAEVDRYLALEVDARRRYLEALSPEDAGDLDGVAAPVGSTPEGDLDRIGAFASARDVCDALGSLQRRAEGHPELAPILELLGEPGPQYRPFLARRPVWGWIGGTDGATDDIHSHARLLRREDGRWFAAILALNGGSFDADERRLLQAIEARLVDLLDEAPDAATATPLGSELKSGILADAGASRRRR